LCLLSWAALLPVDDARGGMFHTTVTHVAIGTGYDAR
jgi:hypothetical protein